eukprot:GEMP01008534.1.p1 GENE.GEMP01008534.1~~GEMP01008534.1.p1  ORF type:complete len:745 (+),score=143.15 GEMP01008534.1:330-2564(+)
MESVIDVRDVPKKTVGIAGTTESHKGLTKRKKRKDGIGKTGKKKRSRDAVPDDTKRRNSTTEESDVEAQMGAEVFLGDADDKRLFLAEQILLWMAAAVTYIYDRSQHVMRGLIFVKFRPFESRAVYVLGIQFLTSDAFQMGLLKILQVLYGVENFIFILAAASFFSFLVALWNIMRFIPCPTVTSLVSNSIILFLFVATLWLAAVKFKNGFIVFQYVMVFWPLVPVASVIARLYIDRDKEINAFSPVFHYPLLGAMGAGSAILIVVGMKQVSLTDGLIALCFDPLWSAICTFIPFPQRRVMTHIYVRFYGIIVFFVFWYYMGEVGMISFANGKSGVPMGIAYIWLGRFCLTLRSIYLKWFLSQEEDAGDLEPLVETWETLFERNFTIRPRKYRFELDTANSNKSDRYSYGTGLSEPVLFRLQCIWDSGLVDDVMHGIGWLGTIDFYTQTDAIYTAWLASMASFVMEDRQVVYGFLPPSLGFVLGELTDTTAADYSPLLINVTFIELTLIVVMFCLFTLSRGLIPYAASLRLFDRGSTPHYWKYTPPLLSAPLFFVDWLFLNPMISDIQIFLASFLTCAIMYYRDTLWDRFWRTHLVHCLMDLDFTQPACLRIMQKEQLFETLKNCHTEDFGNLLMNTCIAHGNNMKDDPNVFEENPRVWPPAPTATAAWKMCKSLVVRSMKRQKELRRQKIQDRADLVTFMGDIFQECVGKAVDIGNGTADMEELLRVADREEPEDEFDFSSDA